MNRTRSDGTVLFLIACSLMKSRGGDPHHDFEESITSRVCPELGSRLLARREEVRRLVTGNRELKWQGVPLADLEFNHALAAGRDFGGRRTAAYRPAIDRYQGRFFQALGDGGRQKVRGGKFATAIVSGLYGLVLPSEGIQLYSCPLDPEVAETWDRDSLLTDVLSDYIDGANVLRVIDLVAIDAYRRLIDWQRVRDSGTDVLHCFDAMASGESALTSFGMVLGSHLLGSSDDELIAMNTDDRVENVIFRSVPKTPTGFPEESAPLLAARHESRLWEPQPAGNHVDTIVRGGNPHLLPSIGRRVGSAWKFTAAKEFQRDLRKHGQQFGRVIEAIVAICQDPMSPHGNTVKPLGDELQGMWRFRLGDFRLIYEPDTEKSVVHFLGLKPRSGAYC